MLVVYHNHTKGYIGRPPRIDAWLVVKNDDRLRRGSWNAEGVSMREEGGDAS